MASIGPSSRAYWLALSCLAGMARAADWNSTDVQYLYGGNWDTKTGQEVQTLVTLEHADAFKYGDNFFFFDVTHPISPSDNIKTEIFGKWNPRLSLGKITGKDLGIGPLADILAAGQIYWGSNPFGFVRVYLYGLGTALKLPGFAFFNLNLFVRDDPRLSGVTYQIAPAWLLPFGFGQTRLQFGGFADFIGPEGDSGNRSGFNIVFQPTLFLDVGNYWGAGGHFFLGTEVDVRYHKFGVPGAINDAVPQAVAMWVF